MALNNRFVMATATGDGPGVDVLMANNDEVTTTPLAHKMNENDMSGDEENQSRVGSVSQGQIDGSTNANTKSFIRDPEDLRYAQVQGLAKLYQVFNDPKREIEENIRNTSGWNPTLASNTRCQKVRKWLSGEVTRMDEHTVPYVLATWCMLGGHIPSVWIPRKPGKKLGFDGKYTDWGEKLVGELQLIGCGNKSEICKDFDNGSIAVRNAFNWDEWEDIRDNPDGGMLDTKKSKPAKKRAMSSPRQSHAAKRQKTAPIDLSQRNEGDYPRDDDTEDEGSRGGVGNEVIDSGEQGVRGWNTSTTMVNSTREGFLTSRKHRNRHRYRENAPQPPQQIWSIRGARGIQDAEGNLGNDAASRRCVPGLKTSNMSSNKTLTGQTSWSHKNLNFLGKPTGPRPTADVLSSSHQDSTASFGQPLFGMPSSLQQASPVPFRVPSSDRGSTTSSGQPSFPKFPILGRRAEYGIGNKSLSSSSLTTKDHKVRSRLHGTVSNRDKSDENPLGTQRVAFASAFNDMRAREEDTAEASKSGFNTYRIIREHAEQYGLTPGLEKQNIEYRAEITRLHNEGSSNRRIVEEIIDEIKPFEERSKVRKTAGDDKIELLTSIRKLREAWEDSERRADHIMNLLNRTSVAALSQSAINQNAELGSTSLAELLEGMHGNHGSGMSGPKESDGYHNRDGDVDEGAPQGLNKDTGEVFEGSAGLGELVGQDDGKGQGDNRVGDAFQNWRGWLEVSSDDSDTHGAFGHR